MNNIYANNFKYYSNEYNIEKYKKLLTKLTNSLLDNQWLRISYYSLNEELKNPPSNYIKYIKTCFKPLGLWFSKGDWLFHSISEKNINTRITLVEINYNDIYKVTNKIPNNYIIDKYFLKKLNFFKKKYSILKLLNNKHYFELIKWKKVIKKYKGFAVYPFIKDAEFDNFLFTFDNSSLVLWNYESIINYYDLGKISDYINLETFNKYNTIIQYKFINKLINKINNINKI